MKMSDTDFMDCGTWSPLILPRKFGRELCEQRYFDHVKQQEETRMREEAQARCDSDAERRRHIGRAGLNPDAEQQTVDDATAAAVRLRANYVERLSMNDGPAVRVFHDEDIAEFRAAIPGLVHDEHSRARLDDIANKFLQRTGEGGLQTIGPHWHDQLDDMLRRLPNFAEVIDHVRCACAVAERGDNVLRLAPILLDGAPGIGKSLFARLFADFIGAGQPVQINLEASQTASQLSGSESHWANAKPGLLFQRALQAFHPNFVLYLEEIDKVRVGEHHADPHAVLLTLLEKSTASEFRDLCLPMIRVDLSHLYVIATANDAALLPTPLCSRFDIFTVPAPNREQSRGIADTLIEDYMRQHFGEAFDAWLDFNAEAMDVLARETPRRMQRLIQGGVGRALLAGRNVVIAADLQQCVAHERRIGFA
jgi:ATP-dependent Lon protease